jgi:hypothetical protein
MEPNPASFYEDLVLKRGTGGLNDYWIAASLGTINLDGSQIFGWKTLESTRAAYLAAHPGRSDKIEGAIDAFGVDASQFAVVIAVFNTDVTDGGAAGGVLVGPNDANVTFLAHETGHVFGLDHSFDTSTRVLMPWPSGPGEYYDRFDIMSAMNVDSDTGHRFSPRGPLLNVANLDRMGWLPGARVWRSLTNSSDSYEVDIVALEHPEVDGYLAAQSGGWIAEFRIPEGFDAGLTRAAVIFHNESANPNSCIVASDAANYIHEWLPGQVYGNPTIFNRFGGTRVTVLSFDLAKKTARLRIQVKATRPPFVELDTLFGLGIGQLPRDGVILVVKNGRITPIPVPGDGPDPILPDLRTAIRAHVLDILRSDVGVNVTDVQTTSTGRRHT